ncbi:MAG TPA: dockerin type I domain-containing protein [Acidobacteriota bacterium]|nr:dockerin type I domain-containing protein [Acidobacteriota bacterium]
MRRFKQLSATSILGLGIVAVAGLLTARGLQEANGAQAPPLQRSQTGHPTFMSPHSNPIVLIGGRVFVANTPADTVDVIDASSHSILARVNVGIDPVAIAVRPDGKEVWVSNHISDSVSVIDSDPQSLTYLQVLATVQDFDPVTKATRFDEPVGLAFADNEKAYVALSSENQVAVISVPERRVVKRLTITAQDPRALTVRGDRLYVIPFESNNQTQISGCTGPVNGDLCTFNAIQHSNNVLSLGIDVDIVKNPAVPDRDLYVFDTTTDRLVRVVSKVGTLLYGLTVDSAGRVFVAQTEARNHVNGRAGTRGDGLAELENRAFLNQIARVDCGGGGCGSPQVIDLEPLPPQHPAPAMALATPYAIQISADDSTLVVSAAGSNKLFTIDAASGQALGRTDVGAVPRGIALESGVQGEPARAWVLNAVSNTVSLVDLSDPSHPEVVETVALEDPTHPEVKRGRMVFHDASASSTGTFSCESCHPDGHTDQLLWVLDTPICSVPGCTQIPPRITMPVRGLRDTAPYHWDGIPGDPYGGRNTANIMGSDPPNSDVNVPESSTRHLVDGGLATTMLRVGDPTVNDEGKPGAFTAGQRDDMARFLLSVPYPPSRRRSFDNVLSDTAERGFKVFHIDGVITADGPNTCGDCHRMPFWVSTNTPETGMDAPTWRGAYDRWLILPQGRVNLVDLMLPSARQTGIVERDMWVGLSPALEPAWNMVTEGSTGFSGSFARQVTLNQGSARSALTDDLLNALEVSASEGAVLLQGEGVFIDGDSALPVRLQYVSGLYVEDGPRPQRFTRSDLIGRASAGELLVTFTGRLGVNVDLDHPQPALWSQGPIEEQRGPQIFPTVLDGSNSMLLSARHVEAGARVYVDGRRILGNVRCHQGGQLPDCSGEDVVVQLATVPPSPGMHFLQVQNSNGLFSNDFIFFSAAGAGCDCDINDDGGVDVADVQSMINEALQSAPPTCDLNQDGAINVADIQAVINAALGGGCQ